MTAEMKEFLMYEFGTIKVSDVNKDALKLKLDGPAFIERISYRKAVAMNTKKEAIDQRIQWLFFIKARPTYKSGSE